jgi:hypothetical protein
MSEFNCSLVRLIFAAEKQVFPHNLNCSSAHKSSCFLTTMSSCNFFAVLASFSAVNPSRAPAHTPVAPSVESAILAGSKRPHSVSLLDFLPPPCPLPTHLLHLALMALHHSLTPPLLPLLQRGHLLLLLLLLWSLPFLQGLNTLIYLHSCCHHHRCSQLPLRPCWPLTLDCRT